MDGARGESLHGSRRVIRGDRPRSPRDAGRDPGRVYHNIAVAIDPARQLFNGNLEHRGLARYAGSRARRAGAPRRRRSRDHTAIIAQAVGPSGRVVGFEIDAALAAAAARNLAFRSGGLRCGDGSGGETFDAIVVNAGVTHPLDAGSTRWLPRTHGVADYRVDAGDGFDTGRARSADPGGGHGRRAS